MADDLAQLIGRLRRVSSPIERMKLLARAWRSLRRMTPGERQALADQVGIADAGDLIEHMATRKGGLSPSAVQRALEALGDRNVGDLRHLVRSLRDPHQRDALWERGLDAAAEAMNEPKAEEAAEEAAEAPREESSAPVGPAAEPPTAPAAPIEKPVTQPVTPPVAPRAATPTTRPSRAPQSEVLSAPQPTVDKEPTTPEDTGVPLLDRISREPMLIRKFRLLRQRVDEARGLTAIQLRDLIDLFPPGWGRRRALDALLESGIPGSLHKAIFLIEHLQSESERRWCVSTLLHEWKLTDEERALLADRHRLFHAAPAAG